MPSVLAQSLGWLVTTLYNPDDVIMYHIIFSLCQTFSDINEQCFVNISSSVYCKCFFNVNVNVKGIKMKILSLIN